ncbi:metalloprotease TldD [mine drainage metagenome]|uniref:Metalloprotease TldD n=1 Tax=mine drainage metagenome TaxID=410659 RepID=A0A1J5Q625_9ZZZZ
MNHRIDESFVSLPLHNLGELAIERSQALGATYAAFRIERIKNLHLGMRDAILVTSANQEDFGMSLRVLLNGTWGFAAIGELSTRNALLIAEQAIEAATISRPLTGHFVEIQTEPIYRDGQYVSAYEIDPWEISDRDKSDLLTAWSTQLLGHSIVDHVEAEALFVKECTYYQDSFGTRTTQQRVRLHPSLTAYAVTESGMDSMRTIAPPVGRGYEYLTGAHWDWAGELAELPELLRERTKAKSVKPDFYDLVIHPSNLWLTIHESIGHATELDRALGYEAAYAGTSFATFDKLGTLQYGSKLMNVTGDRNIEHGLATVGWDHEGVASQQWDLIKDGLLVGYQLDRQMSAQKGFPRSNGCAFADSPLHVPVQRMANVSLAPKPDGGTTDDLIADVENGLYVVGDKSWSIDMQRFNFQFTAQRFFEIKNGKLGAMVKDAAYTSTTTDFWNSMKDVGGSQTWELQGAFNCGKAQPGQVAPVSHGAPSARFQQVRVLNTVEEAGR